MQRVEVLVTDDLDGTEGAKPFTFGLDGNWYEIDLVEANVEKLRKELAPFIKAARSARRGAGPTAGGRRSRRSGNPGLDTAAVRAWATKQGLQIANRGRIPASVLAQYQEAQKAA
jgi:nucleoid-associated protein Lsr2